MSCFNVAGGSPGGLPSQRGIREKVLDASCEPDTIAQNVREAFRGTWPESPRQAPRFANIVPAATLTLMLNA